MQSMEFQVSTHRFVFFAKYLLSAASNSTPKVLQPDVKFARVYDSELLWTQLYKALPEKWPYKRLLVKNQEE